MPPTSRKADACRRFRRRLCVWYLSVRPPRRRPRLAGTCGVSRPSNRKRQSTRMRDGNRRTWTWRRSCPDPENRTPTQAGYDKQIVLRRHARARQVRMKSPRRVLLTSRSSSSRRPTTPRSGGTRRYQPGEGVTCGRLRVVLPQRADTVCGRRQSVPVAGRLFAAVDDEPLRRHRCRRRVAEKFKCPRSCRLNDAAAASEMTPRMYSLTSVN